MFAVHKEWNRGKKCNDKIEGLVRSRVCLGIWAIRNYGEFASLQNHSHKLPCNKILSSHTLLVLLTGQTSTEVNSTGNLATFPGEL